MKPKWTEPESMRKVPNWEKQVRKGWGGEREGGRTRKKKRTGPARSESSIRCWSTREKGFRTAKVWGVNMLV